MQCFSFTIKIQAICRKMNFSYVAFSGHTLDLVFEPEIEYRLEVGFLFPYYFRLVLGPLLSP